MKLIAHRGVVNKYIKENTLKAFNAAIKDTKYVGFELDVRQTKDNRFVIHHDLLHNEKFICNYNYKEIKEEIPLLSSVLKLDTDKIYLIEIKDHKIDYKLFLKIINKYSNKNIYVMSFHNWVIDKLCEYHVPVKLGILNYVLNSESDYHLEFIGLLNNLATRNLINAYQNRNVEVFLYGIINEDKDIIYDDVYYIVDEVPSKN